MRYGKIARVAGEAFDADQLEWRCKDCGKNEYKCECEEYDEDWYGPVPYPPNHIG